MHGWWGIARQLLHSWRGQGVQQSTWSMCLLAPDLKLHRAPCRHHHKYPMDFDRLVFPPAIAALVIGVFYALLHAIMPMVGCVLLCVLGGCVRWGALRAAARSNAHGGLLPVV